VTPLVTLVTSSVTKSLYIEIDKLYIDVEASRCVRSHFQISKRCESWRRKTSTPHFF